MEAIEITIHGLVHGGFGLLAGAAEFGVGAVPGAFENGDLTLHSGEEFSGRRIREEGRGEGCAKSFGE